MALPQTIVGKNGKEYSLQQFNVKTNWHNHAFNVTAYGYPHARNIVNKMLGRLHTATDGIQITRVGQVVKQTAESTIAQPQLF